MAFLGYILFIREKRLKKNVHFAENILSIFLFCDFGCQLTFQNNSIEWYDQFFLNGLVAVFNPLITLCVQIHYKIQFTIFLYVEEEE